MKLLSRLCIFVMLFLFSQDVLALQIVYPKEGQIVEAGSKLTVIVKADTGEEWEKVLIAIFPMSYNPLTKEYTNDIEIQADVLGEINFSILAYDKTGKKIKLTRNLLAKMPPNVVLQSILVSEDLMVLYTAPTDMNPADKEKIESDQVSVAGVYSDGVNRPITSSAIGTTYASSDGKIVVVDSEGRVTAKGIGRAKITVRNGKYSAEVKVIVKPYKK